MSYEVIARKYRPQTFEDVVGQDHVVTTLRNAISQERIAHAYLFVGPRGTGKTSSARIFAKALNCGDGPTPTPCGTCANCTEISEGRSLDVIEIDGASNNGVEQVRELRESVHFMPASGRYKVYIIDEVHMLSIAAFNALLKTLEEPPEHVIFLFATTEAHKVPATILSRCQRFDLRRIGAREIVTRLQFIAEKEGIQVEEAAMVAIARGADGGMRDAQSALDQLIAFKGKQLAEADVLSVFGMVSHKLVAELAEALLTGEVAAAVRTINAFDRTGKDLQRVLFDLLDHLRAVAVYSYTHDVGLLDEMADAHAASIKEQADLLPPSRITEMLDLLVQAESRLKFSLSRKTTLELALIQCARAAKQVTVDEMIADIQALKEQLGAGGGSDEKKKVATDPPQAAAPANEAVAPPAAVDSPVTPASAEPPPPPPKSPAPEATPPRSLDLEEGTRLLARLAAEPGLRGLFAHARWIGGLDQRPLRAELQLDEPSFRTIDEAFHRLTGAVVREVTGETAGVELTRIDPVIEEAADERPEWLRNPVVESMLELFSGDIEDVRRRS